MVAASSTGMFWPVFWPLPALINFVSPLLPRQGLMMKTKPSLTDGGACCVVYAVCRLQLRVRTARTVLRGC